MNDSVDPREAALRRLPTAYSLALRLREAGVEPDLICEYLGIEPEALAPLLDIAEAKLTCALQPDGSRETAWELE
ncbi:hypothetical protein ACWEOI_28485 [Nocardia sp. NPDC004340]|uniref:hypothetical protein n=1 Tax=Nocardia sp. CA-136227 TaxID=3239979 RepID=UPI003D97AB14